MCQWTQGPMGPSLKDMGPMGPIGGQQAWIRYRGTYGGQSGASTLGELRILGKLSTHLSLKTYRGPFQAKLV